MRAARHVFKVPPEGKVDLSLTEFEQGTAVEVIVLSAEDSDDLDFSDFTALLSQEAFARIWDSPEEDEAWKDL
jgi:hypothetical protein